jgi:Fe-S cluster assembly protein SufD
MIGSEKESLFLTLQKIYEKQRVDRFSSLRDRAWEIFRELGLPEKKMESFQYLPWTHFYQQMQQKDFSEKSLTKEEVQNYRLSSADCLVYVDGFFKPELSSLENLEKTAVILSLEEAGGAYSHFLQQRFQTILNKKESLSSLNSALFQEGAFIYLPAQCICTRPLQILHIITKDVGIAMPRLHLSLGKRASLEVISQTIYRQEGQFWNNAVIDLFLEEESSLLWTTSQWKQPESWHFERVQALLKKRARLQTLSLLSGKSLIRQDLQITLNGEESHAQLEGISMLSSEEQSHVHAYVEHLSPQASSHQGFKSLLRGNSRSSFQGEIFVAKEAQKTEAYQKSQHLLLSPHALAYSKPRLQIFADDVKASHGATVSKVDEEQLFYLKSRGLLEDQAHHLLLQAFCQDLISKIPVSLKSSLQPFLETYFYDT